MLMKKTVPDIQTDNPSNIKAKEMTLDELRSFIESMPEGTVISLEIKVVLENA